MKSQEDCPESSPRMWRRRKRKKKKLLRSQSPMEEGKKKMMTMMVKKKKKTKVAKMLAGKWPSFYPSSHDDHSAG